MPTPINSGSKITKNKVTSIGMESANAGPPGEKKMVTFESHERYPDNQIKREIRQANSVDNGGHKSREAENCQP